MSTDRPMGVRFISFLLGLNGLISIVVGGLLLAHKGEDLAIDALGVSGSDLTTVAITALVAGAITLLLAISLRSGSNLARFLLAALWLAQVGVLIYAMVETHSVHWTNAMWPTAITGLAAFYLLLDKDAREFFAKS